MKKTLSFLLALCMLAGSVCLSVGAADDVNPAVQELIDEIDGFFAVDDLFNSCDERWITYNGESLDCVPNPNSNFYDSTDDHELYLEGAGAQRLTRTKDGSADLPIQFRSAEEFYVSGHNTLTVDIYISEDTKINTEPLSEDLSKYFAVVKLQSAFNNNLDDNTVYEYSFLDDLKNLKPGQWNQLVVPLSPDITDAYRQITLRFGHDTIEMPTRSYMVFDNVALHYTDERKIVAGDKPALDALQAKYEALSPDEQKLVTNYDKLAGWLKELEAALGGDAEVIEKMEQMLTDLPDAADVTEADRAKIEAAREAFNNLTNAQRQALSGALLNRLLEAEEALEQLTPSSTPSVPSTPSTSTGKRGDVNADGNTNAADALLVLRAAVNKTTLTAAQKAVADLDGNNAINAADALLILRIAVGKG